MSEFNELKKAVEEVLKKHLGSVALNAFELEWVSMPFPYRIDESRWNIYHCGEK